jgi:hypothetical protein
MLLRDEVEHRAQRKFRLRGAAFDPIKTLQSVDFSFILKQHGKAQFFGLARGRQDLTVL